MTTEHVVETGTLVVLVDVTNVDGVDEVFTVAHVEDVVVYFFVELVVHGVELVVDVLDLVVELVAHGVELVVDFV